MVGRTLVELRTRLGPRVLYIELDGCPAGWRTHRLMCCELYLLQQALEERSLTLLDAGD